MSDYLKGAVVLTLFVAAAFSCNDSNAQVSVFTEPESDSIVFETHKAKTTVEPKAPATRVDIPTTYGTSSFYVSPGGYVSPAYEVDDD